MLLGAMLALCLPAASSASTLQVVNLNDSGPGSLRATMNAANPGDTIDIPAGTITLTSGPLFPPVALTLVGAGAGSTAISGGTTQQRIMFAGHDLTLHGITFENGHGSGGGANAGGGAIDESGGSLTITACAFANNSWAILSPNSGDNGGGAIYLQGGGSLSVADSTFSANTVTDQAGNSNGGGAIFTASGTAPVTLTRDTFTGDAFTESSGSQSDGGGALYSLNDPVSVTASTFSGESATIHGAPGAPKGNGGGAIWSGGGVTVAQSSLTGNTVTMTSAGSENGGGAIYNAQDPLTVTASTVAGNAADLGLIEFVSNGGGGLFNDDNGGTGGTGGAVTLTNTTLVNNVVAGSGTGGNQASGGGIYDLGAGGTITNTTISGNSASFPAGGAGGGGIYENGTSGTLTLHNAIVAGNSVTAFSPGGLGGRNCDFNPAGTKIVSAGHNISDDATCALTASGDQPNTTPGLGPLAANGGRTQTEALLPASSAIDHGDATGCPATDQRGVTRPAGSACDVGAYEYAPPATSATILTCSGTLRATLTPAAGSIIIALLVRIDGGAVRTIPASGSPAVATVALAAGHHTVEYWGEGEGGDVEQGHHTVSGASDTGLPTVTITSSPRTTAYGFGTTAILTIHAQSPAGLLGRPNGARVKLATNRAGAFTFTATVTNACHRSRTVHYRYRVKTLFTTTFTLPASGRCLRGSKLVITIHAPPGIRLTQIVVTAGGTRVQRRGRLPHVLLVPFPRAGFFTLHVQASGHGRVVSGSVRYRVC